MTQTKHVHWKSRDPDNTPYLGGTCPPDQVPSYGEVGNLDLPTKVEVRIDERGNLYATSPLVFGARKAYRYSLSLAASSRETLDAERAGSHLSVHVYDAPHKSVSKTNWWWSEHENYRHLPFMHKTPVSLMTRWKGAMLEVLLEGHPDRDRVLEEWNGSVQRHRDYVRRTAPVRTPNHRKKPGDLVVMPHPIPFTNGEVLQIFRYQHDTDRSDRAKYTLATNGMTYRTPHGKAMTFPKGVVPDADLSPAIRMAMLLLSWSNEKATTAHLVLAKSHHYRPLIEQTQREIDTWLKEPGEAWRDHDILAAVAAIHDFTRATPKDQPATAGDMMRILSGYRAAFLEQMKPYADAAIARKDEKTTRKTK